MAKFCYTVIRGWQPGIYRHWSSCRDQVHKLAGQDYIGCNSIEEAELLLRKKGINNYYDEFNQTLEETTVPLIPRLALLQGKLACKPSTTAYQFYLGTWLSSLLAYLLFLGTVVLIALMVRLIFLL
ncbi:hypothetical protein IFM89_038156 [Coptis chinensis]|uniref:Ribonuclease H1 N-terminal domain-containing protein n=1 Tax=Coptis chinensis TaxID=261450 RepID=A0A835HVF3_9MAGN|nr:hypothetical protein IFM89_038156 [Coptis chinensis]